MYLMMILSAVAGAVIFFAGWYTGYWLNHKQQAEMPVKKARKSRPPKCWVVVPGEPDKEQKKRRKKRRSSVGAAPVPFDESKIKGRDIYV